ncbi:DNA alkylation repair enzyme [Longilinea arvoryzae]|uniref:DNA alkylation repair enzyme n=1 Tax=Longilinea arvoryzae TaxID=360412 RepID=A0A0S7BKT4_9CHLR|nr:DNA alkylation repair protein [Longilinea arvoryzae]GAP15267.1 DNA alkylation repair enzyme [Longilinea arvoryzae]
MPAVQLIRLKKQAAELATLFSQPADFVAKLRSIFEQYSDLTFHAGQAAKPASLLPSYHCSDLIIKEIELSLAPLCASQPQEALAMIDRLWVEEYLEPRQLACRLIGRTALEPFQPVLERLESWSLTAADTSLTKLLLDLGSQRLRHEAPDRWLDILRNWMESSNLALRSNALTALLPFIQDREYENLPVVFNLITPALQQNAANLSSELQKALTSLARRSSVETGYFLRQILATSSEPALQRLVRRCLPAFPVQTQARLKTAMQTRPPSNQDA